MTQRTQSLNPFFIHPLSIGQQCCSLKYGCRLIGTECLGEQKFMFPTSPAESFCSCSMMLQPQQSGRCSSATCQVLIPSLSRLAVSSELLQLVQCGRHKLSAAFLPAALVLSVLSFCSLYSVRDVNFLLHFYLWLWCTRSSGTGQQGLQPVRAHAPCERDVCSTSIPPALSPITDPGNYNSGQNVYRRKVQ